MTRNTQSEDRSVRAELNSIAEPWSTDGTLPNGTTMEDVAESSSTVAEQIGDVIDTYVAETTLTRREAEVWNLRRFYGKNGARLTFEAIALVLAAPGSPFEGGHGTDSGRDEAKSPTAETVETCHERAAEKYAQAKEFVGLTTFRDRDEHLVSPQMVWLDAATITRIKDHTEPEDVTRDDILRRVLDEAETCRLLEELSREYLEARGKDNVSQLAVNGAKQTPRGGRIIFSAHTAIQEELPEVVKNTHAVMVDGQRFDFVFQEDPGGPYESKHRTTIYAADNIVGMDPVEVDDGVEAAREQLQDYEAAVLGGDQL